MGNTTRNFHAHGGSEWVVGGKLTFLPGAVVEGAEGLFDLPSTGEPVLPYMPNSEATTVAALRENFNLFLTLLRSAGFMAAETNDQPAE